MLVCDPVVEGVLITNGVPVNTLPHVDVVAALYGLLVQRRAADADLDGWIDELDLGYMRPIVEASMGREKLDEMEDDQLLAQLGMSRAQVEAEIASRGAVT